MNNAQLLAACVAAVLASSPAASQPAPSQNYAAVEAVPGKSVRIGLHGTVSKKDCSPLRAPAIRVLESPASGSLPVQARSVMSNKVEECPPIKVPLRVLIYTARSDSDTDRDHIVYEVRSANGEVATHHITIVIKPAPAPDGRIPEQKT